MADPIFYMTMATTGLAAVAIVTSAGLVGWRGWLQLKTQELAAQATPAEPGMPVANAGARIEIADLKERIRKLEAIAAGVDL